MFLNIFQVEVFVVFFQLGEVLYEFFFEDFRFNQLVVQIVEIVLYFAVGQFAVDQVAEVVVVIAHQFFAVDGDGGKAVDVETLVFGNKIVKEQMIQMISKEDSEVV